MRRWLPLAPLAVLLLLGALFAGYALRRPSPEVRPAALVGQPVPAAALPALDGEGGAVALRSVLQGPMLINVFASWCAPCAVEHPQLMALKARGVRIVGIAWKDEPANSRAFLNRLGDPFALVLVDRPGDVGVDFGVSGVPETFLVDADGIIFAKHSGPMTADDAAAIAARLDGRR